MTRFERDTLMRQVRQLADMIAALVLRARAEGSYESGLEAIREASGRALGVDRAVLDRLDPASAAMLLRGADLIRTHAWICGEEADLLLRAGDAGAAGARRLRAVALYAEAAARDRSQDGACRDAARELAADSELSGLDEGCRRWLAGPVGPGPRALPADPIS